MLSESITYRLMRKNEVLHLIGVSKSSLYRMIASGHFPPSVVVGKKAVAWPEHEVREIVGTLVAGMSRDEIRCKVDEMKRNRVSNHGN